MVCQSETNTNNRENELTNRNFKIMFNNDDYNHQQQTTSQLPQLLLNKKHYYQLSSSLDSITQPPPPPPTTTTTTNHSSSINNNFISIADQTLIHSTPNCDVKQSLPNLNTTSSIKLDDFLDNLPSSIYYSTKTKCLHHQYDDDDDDDEDVDEIECDIKESPSNHDSVPSSSNVNTFSSLSSSPSLSVTDEQQMTTASSITSSASNDDTQQQTQQQQQQHQLQSTTLATTPQQQQKQSYAHRHSLQTPSDLISLSSLTSNYSQFDFININLNEQAQSQQQQLQSTPKEKKPSSSFSAFLTRFTKNNTKMGFNSTTTGNVQTTSSSSSSASGGLLSKLFDSKTSKKPQNSAPNTVLILENRPSNLPAKSEEEAQKHKQEYEKMVEIAKKKEQKEVEMKQKKLEQQLKKEDFMANSLRIWNTEILIKWDEMKSAKRTQQLWWHGIPPSVRGKVWKLAIGNDLGLTPEDYYTYEKKAQEKIEILSRKSNDHCHLDKTIVDDNSMSHESGVELIKLDVSRTFPQLCFFQQNGPYHDVLHSVLGAYACYNSKIGYVQGMSFLAAILLLNMDASDAFICLSNLLNTNYLIACFRMDQYKMSCYFKIHQILFQHNLPILYEHFEYQKVKPDLYLIEWIFTLFSKSLPLDVVSRVWDVYFRDKDEFLFRTAIAILNLYKDILLKMDFIHIVQFLTKLPEDINSTHLFKSIEIVKTSIDNDNLSFKQLVSSIVQ